MGKLPVWGTVKESFDFCFSRFGTMAKLATVPLILYVFIMGIAFALAPDMFSQEVGEANNGGSVSGIANLLAAIAIIPFATAWHRQYLSSDGEPSGWLSYSYGKRETRYLLFSFLLMLIIFAAVFVPVLLGLGSSFLSGSGFGMGHYGVILVILFVTPFIIVRLAMIFPAAAVGAPAGLKDSWRATKGSFWRMLSIYILLGLLMIIPMIVITMIIGVLFGGAAISGDTSAMAISGILSVMILVPFEMIASAISVSCLSIIYKFLSEKDNAVHAAG